MDIAREMLTTFNDNPDLLKKMITGDKTKFFQCLIIPMGASRRAKTEKCTSCSVKGEGFTHCFLRLQ